MQLANTGQRTNLIGKNQIQSNNLTNEKLKIEQKSLSSFSIRHIQESFGSYIRSDINRFAPLEL